MKLITVEEYRRAARRVRDGSHPHHLISALYALELETGRHLFVEDVPELTVTTRNSWPDIDADQEAEALDIAAELAGQRPLGEER